MSQNVIWVGEISNDQNKCISVFCNTFLPSGKAALVRGLFTIRNTISVDPHPKWNCAWFKSEGISEGNPHVFKKGKVNAILLQITD